MKPRLAALFALYVSVSALATGGAGYDLAIQHPSANSSVRANDGTITMRLRLEPMLREGHHLELVVDGEVVPETFHAEAFEISGLSRGSHTVQVRIVDQGGTLIGESDAVTFHVQRYSRLFEPGAETRPGGVRQAPRAPMAPRAPRFEYNPVR